MLKENLEEDIKNWLNEDIPYWDISLPLVPDKKSSSEAEIIAKQDGIVAGLFIIEFMLKKQEIIILEIIKDGAKVKKGEVIVKIKGETNKILLLERVMLNILGHLSGIATLTNEYVMRINEVNKKTIIAATRKTTPGLRKYQKYAVKIGGGDTHRLDLSSMAMIKENHIVMYEGIINAINEVRNVMSFSQKLEIEVKNEKEALIAANEGVDIIMLDNFELSEVNQLVKKLKNINPKMLIEISGDINAKTFDKYLDLNVDIISMGELTHSVRNFNLSLIIKENL